MTSTDVLSDPDARFAVVDELRRLAGSAELAGNRAVQCGDYRTAVPDLMLAARYDRAANALTAGVRFDPRDRQQVEQACTNVKKCLGQAARPLAAIGGAW